MARTIEEQANLPTNLADADSWAGERIRLKYLDGVRGLAAMFVVLHHVHQELTWREDLPRGIVIATRWLTLGHYAVAVFIVLSGYSLMLPVVRSPQRQLKGGFRKYMVRRSRRILPPYFAVLAFALALIAVVPPMRRVTGFSWNLAVPVTPGAVVSHLLLIENLNLAWAVKINPPMWSVATEWQIYFMFPLLLLPLWRRWGTLAMIVTAYSVGVALAIGSQGRLDGACPWYLGLFAAGMGAAVVNFDPDDAARRVRSRVPWSLLSVGFGVSLLAAVKLHAPWMVADGVAGLAAACLLVACTLGIENASGKRSWILRWFESNWAVRLGTVSYTLYLIHSPLITLAHLGVRQLFGHDPIVRMLLLPLISALLIAPLTYAFYVLFERPFMRGHPRTPEKAALSAAMDPAP